MYFKTKIGRGISSLELDLLDCSDGSAILFLCQSDRFRNEKFPTCFFKDFPTLEIINIEKWPKYLIGILFLLMVAQHILCEEKRILEGDFVTLGNIDDLLMALAVHFENIDNRKGYDDN